MKRFLLAALLVGCSAAQAQTSISGATVRDGTLPPNKITAIGAGTVLANSTGSSASPIAVPYGLVLCAGVDDTARIQAALDSQQNVKLLGSPCVITSGLTITKTGVGLIGSGMDAGHQSGVESGNTIIKWAGADNASTDAMLSIQPAAAATRHLSGVSVKGITFDATKTGATGEVGYGVRVRSAYYTDLDVRVIEPMVSGVYLGTLDTLTGDGINTQYTSGRISVRQTQTDGGACVVFDGSQTPGVAGNASFNTLESIACTVGNGDGVVFRASDNNQIRKVSVSRQPSGTTGRDVRFQGSNGTGTPLIPNVARANRIDLVSASDGSDGVGGITYEGTDLWTNPSHDNVVTLDKDNGTPPPIVGPGVLGPLHWSLNNGVMDIGPTLELNMGLNRIRAVNGTNLRLIAPAGNSVWIGTFDNATAVQVSPGLRAGTGLTDQGLGTINNTGGYYLNDVPVIDLNSDAALSNISASASGADSVPAVSLTGTWFSGGTATTTKPQLLIQPSGTTSAAWSTAGTGLGLNAASGFVGNLLDMQVNGTSEFSVSNIGRAIINGGIAVTGGSTSISGGNITLNNSGGSSTVQIASGTTTGAVSIGGGSNSIVLGSPVLQNTTKLSFSGTAPTISSGFGTSPSIPAHNGSLAFTVDVGSGGTASGGVVGLPAATTGWICSVNNVTAKAANRADQGTFQTATTTTTVTIQNQTISTGAALAWTASDIIQMSCTGY